MRSAALVATAVTFVACGDRDRSTSNELVPQWFIDTTRTLDIPAQAGDGTLQLANPVGATRFGDGTIAVADAMASAVRFFDENGVLRQSVGRDGAGPGEFASLSWLGRCGIRSLSVWDRQLSRITQFDDSGRVVWLHQLPVGREGEVPPVLLSCSRTGTSVAIGQPTPQEADGRFARFRGPIMVGTTTDQLRGVGASTVVTEWDTETRQSRPLGVRSFVAAADDRFFLAMTDSAVVTVHDLAGVLLRTIPVRGEARPPTPAHVQAAAEALTARISNLDLRRRIQERATMIPAPERLPAFGGLFVDGSGIVWVQLSIPGDSTLVLRGFHPDGAPVAELNVPMYITIFEIGEDYVLGHYEAPSGEPHLVLHRFARAP